MHFNVGPTEIHFLVHPKNQSIVQYEKLELQCSINSLTIFNATFSWNFTKRGSSSHMQIVKENISLSSDYSFRVTSNSASLIAESAQWKHAGVYTCIVTGGSDIIQTESSLDVLGNL